MLLGVVAQGLKPVELFAPCKQTQHCEFLCPFHIALSVSCGVSKAFSHLCSGELCILRHSESYRESDSFALNQKDIIIFLKNIFGTKRTVSVDSDTILYFSILLSLFFLPFFYSSALSVFDMKMKIECKGNQYIVL